MADIIDQDWLLDGLSTRRDEDGIITHNESTIIKFDETVSTGPEAILSSGFKEGQEHRNDFNLFLNGSIEANPEESNNGTVWRFDLQYTTSGFNLPTPGGPNERAIIEFGEWTYTKVVESDKKTHKPIVNTAGDLYDPLPEEIIFNPVIMVTLRQNSAKIDRILEIGSINDSDISIAGVPIPAHCAQLAGYRPVPSYDEEGYLTFLNTYTIKLNFSVNHDGERIGFKIESISAGFNQKVDGELEPITIEDEDGTKIPVATPQMLDESGALTTTPFYETWTVNKETSFSSFGLPSSYPVT